MVCPPFSLTGEWYVKKQLAYVEETCYGDTPTNPSFTHAGPIVELNDNQETQAVKYRQIGTRDVYALIKTGELYTFDVTLNPLGTELLEYCINTEDTPAATKHIGKSLSFVKSQLVNGTEMYTVYRGCRAQSIDLTVTADGNVEAAITFQAKEITTPNSTHGLGTVGSWGTTPTETPWTNFASGTGPFRIAPTTAVHGNAGDWGTGTIAYVNNFTMSVTHNLNPVKVNGDSTVMFLEPTQRDITFEFDELYHDTAHIADSKALTARKAEYTLKAAPSGARIDFDDIFLETMGTSDSTSSTDPKMLSFTGTAKTASLVTLT